MYNFVINIIIIPGNIVKSMPISWLQKIIYNVFIIISIYIYIILYYIILYYMIFYIILYYKVRHPNFELV